MQETPEEWLLRKLKQNEKLINRQLCKKRIRSGIWRGEFSFNEHKKETRGNYFR